MNNYYQTPNFNEQQNNEAVMQKRYYYDKAKRERRQIRHLGNILGLTVTAYVIIQLASSLLLETFGLYDFYIESALFQTCFGIVVVDLIGIVGFFGIMALINRKKYTSQLIPTAKLPFGKCCLWVSFGMLCCILSNYLVSIVSTIFESLGRELTEYETPEPSSVVTSIAIAIGTAVMPALCEEFAMRCCGIGLLKKHGNAFAVISISIMFGLIHGNLIQFIFATSVGLILGYVTIKTGSIVPAVLIHLLNNGISVFTKIAEYAFNVESSDSITFWFLLWTALGLIGTLVLISKGAFKKGKKPAREPYQNSLMKKVSTFFFVPGMLVPFLFFITMIILSIK